MLINRSNSSTNVPFLSYARNGVRARHVNADPRVGEEDVADADAAATLALINAQPVVIDNGNGGDSDDDDDEDSALDEDVRALRDDVYSAIRHIRDPEHPYSLEQLGIVRRAYVHIDVEHEHDDGQRRVGASCGMPAPTSLRAVHVQFTPTVPHCSLATLIGLCIRARLSEHSPFAKVQLRITPGSHRLEHELNKQLNDKERVLAALDNPALKPTVTRLCRHATSSYE